MLEPRMHGQEVRPWLIEERGAGLRTICRHQSYGYNHNWEAVCSAESIFVRRADPGMFVDHSIAPTRHAICLR